MKKIIINILISLPVLTVFYACNTDELMYYSKQPDVYFTDLNNPLSRIKDTTKLSFFYISGTEIVAKVPISVTGTPADYDREVLVEPDPALTTAIAGQHYELLPAVIPAGKVMDSILVRIFRTPELSINGEVLRLALVLKPNSEFGIDFRTALDNNTKKEERSLIEYNIFISDVMSEPIWWKPRGFPPTVPSPFFGDYSNKKFRLICDVNGCPPAFFSLGFEWNGLIIGDGVQGGPVNNSMQILILLAKRTQIYLNAEEAAGRTVYEDYLDQFDNPVKMKMGTSGQP